MLRENGIQRRGAGLPALLLAVALFGGTAWGQPGGHGPGCFGDWMMGGRAVGGMGMIVMFLIWGLFIVGFVLLIKWLLQTTGSRGQGDAGAADKAVGILKARYARGEIDRETFETMKQDVGR